MAIATRDLVNLVKLSSVSIYFCKNISNISIYQGFKGGWDPSSREQAIPQLISLYKSKGVSILDMMALSGGHTIGFSQCKEFMRRI
jgi:peroxidase